MADEPKSGDGKGGAAGKDGGGGAPTGDGGGAPKKGADDGDGGAGYQLRKEREAREAAEKELATYRAKLKERDEAELSELDKAKKRAAELEPFKAKAEKAQSTLQRLFEIEIEEIDEKDRPKVDRIVGKHLELEDRLTMVRELKREGLFTLATGDGDSRKPAPKGIDTKRPTDASLVDGIDLNRLNDHTYYESLKPEQIEALYRQRKKAG